MEPPKDLMRDCQRRNQAQELKRHQKSTHSTVCTDTTAVKRRRMRY